MKRFKYGMRLRGFSIGCQPMKGLVDAQDDGSGEYWSVLWYDHELSDRECEDYSLDYLGIES